MSSKIVLITGASSGIGEATARELAKHSFRLVICGRNTQKLDALKKELSASTDVISLAFDVRNREAVEQSINSLPEDWSQIDVLINNAGNAHGLDEIHKGSVQDWEDMIDINVKGLLYVTKCIVPGMVDRKSGHVVNIGSTAGKEAYPKGNVYCASKHAVDAINNGMRMDLLPYGVKVSQINPGLVNTGFAGVRFKGDMSKAEKVYEGMTPLYAQDIAELIWFVISRPAHVNVSDTIIMPAAQASSTQVLREL